MRDPRWAAAFRVLVARAAPTDVVLLPRGDWGPLPCRVDFYDGVITLDCATVLALHKGRLTGLAKTELAGIVREWRCVFANDVLVVYARDWPRALADRVGLYFWHKRRVLDHLRARSLRRLPATIFYVHIPKTGGTAVLFALRRLFRCCVYYTTTEAFLAHPPQPGEYDLVAVHAHASLVLPLLREGDVVAGLVREPARRFLSGVTHSRRTAEDIETFTPTLREMRDTDMEAFLTTEGGRAEARLQLLLLGSSHEHPGHGDDDSALLARALALVKAPHALFAPASQSQDLLEALMGRFGLRAPRLPRRNTNDAGTYARQAVEFQRARAQLDALQTAERTLVEAIRDQFSARQRGKVSLLRKPANAIRPSGQGP